MHRTAVKDRDSAVQPSAPAASDRCAIDVLLVTSDPDLREAGERALAESGYRVRVAAHSGHAVLAGLTSHVDVLVAELSTPDISGPALAQLLRKYHPGLRVVFMANPGTPDGIDHVIVRPFTRDDLIARIRATSSAS